jgi:Histone deacetylase domain
MANFLVMLIICQFLIRAFDPDLILISAGFDAARGDALGDCDITPAGYAALTSSLISCAPHIPLILILEGGYNLQSVGASIEAVTRVLLGEVPISTSAYDLIPNRVAESTILDGGDGGCGISSYSNQDAQALKSNLTTARQWRDSSNLERQMSDIHPRRRVRPATWYSIEETLRLQAPFWPCFAQALAARGRNEREVEEEEDVDETEDLLASLSLK